MAVEMCKLSLWLVSLDPELPFSFVDDKVLHGNSLLGLTDLRQLEALHIDPPTKPLQAQIDFSGDELVERLDIDYRIQRAIRCGSSSRPRSTSATHSAPRMPSAPRWTSSTTSPRAPDRCRRVIAAGLALGGKPGKELDEAYENLRLAVGRAYPADPSTADRADARRDHRRRASPRRSTPTTTVGSRCTGPSRCPT